MVAPIVAAGIGLGGLQAVGGALGASSARSKQNERLREALAGMERGRAHLGRGYADAISEQRGAVSTLEDGVLNALGSLDDGFAAEVRRVMEERVQAQANLDQDLASRGLYGSTAALSYQRALGSDANRAIGDIQGRFAGARADTFLRGSGAVAGAQSGLGSLFAQRGQAFANVDAQKAGLLAGAQVPVMNPLQGAGQLGGVLMQEHYNDQANQRNQALLAAIRGGGAVSGAQSVPGLY